MHLHWVNACCFFLPLWYVLVREKFPKNRQGSLFFLFVGPVPKKGRSVYQKPSRNSRQCKRRPRDALMIFNSSVGRSTYVYFIRLIMFCSSKPLRLTSCYHLVALVSAKQPMTSVCHGLVWRSPSWTFPLRYSCLLLLSNVCISPGWVSVCSRGVARRTSKTRTILRKGSKALLQSRAKTGTNFTLYPCF